MSAPVFALFPHACLAGGGLVVLCATMIVSRPPRWLLPLLAALAVLPAGLWAFVPGPVDGLTRFSTALLCLVTLASLGLIAGHAEKRGYGGDAVSGLVVWSALGMLLLAGARDWLVLAIGLEMASLCLYALVAARLDDPNGTEAALKYFLPGAMALAVLLFGIALVYAGSGRLDIAASLSAGGPIVVAGLGLILVGLGFKLSLAPVHLWTPDVYQGAPAPMAAFLSTGSKAATAVALIRLAGAATPEARELLWPALAVTAGLTMAVGNIGALCQRSLKRLLAYSSIAQMGYVVLAVLAVAQGGQRAALFYLAVYVLLDLGAFGALGTLSGLDADRDAVTAYRGLGYRFPWRAGALAVSLAGLAGLPPTAGFIGKFVIFGAALGEGYAGLAIFGVLMAAIGISYSLRVMAVLYMRPALEAHPVPVPSTGPAAGWVLAVLTGLLLWLGLFPGPLLAALTRLLGGAP